MSIDPLTPLELANIERAKAEESAVIAREKARQAEAENDALKLQALIPQLTPKRDGCAWDWRVGAFRNPEGLVFDGKTWEADKFTGPRAIPAQQYSE